MNNNYKVLISCIVCFVIISLYGSYRCKNPKFHDPLMNKLGILDLDGWSITHFVFFLSLGYFFPDTIVLSMSLGIGWELFEQLIGKARPGMLGGFGDCVTTDPGIHGSWWFGRLSDIVMNASGFLLGMYISNTIKKSTKKDN